MTTLSTRALCAPWAPTTLTLRTVWVGVVILKDIIFGLLNYTKQNGYLKILIECVYRNDGRGGGDDCLQSLPSIKKKFYYASIEGWLPMVQWPSIKLFYYQLPRRQFIGLVFCGKVIKH